MTGVYLAPYPVPTAFGFEAQPTKVKVIAIATDLVRSDLRFFILV